MDQVNLSNQWNFKHWTAGFQQGTFKPCEITHSFDHHRIALIRRDLGL